MATLGKANGVPHRTGLPSSTRSPRASPAKWLCASTSRRRIAAAPLASSSSCTGLAPPPASWQSHNTHTLPPRSRLACGASAAAAQPSSAGASFPATVVSLTNVIVGAGYVSIAYACTLGGWATIGVLWLLGAVFCYTANMVLKCCAVVEARQGAGAAPCGYEAVAGAAFGGAGRALVSAVMYAELLGLCCCYLVLEAETLATLLGHTQFGADLLARCGGGGFVLLASALVLPTVLLPDLEALAALGAAGVAAAVTVGGVLAWLCWSTPPALMAQDATVLVLPATLPQVLGICAFVYAGHSTFPVIQQSMAAPGRGRSAVTWAYIATAAVCTAVGVFGYSLWGPASLEVATANLPVGSMLAAVVTTLTVANPFAAFAPTLEPVAVAVQEAAMRSSGSSDGSSAPYALRAAIRLGLALALAGVALVLPYVAELVGLVGALLTMSISLILPALMHLLLLGAELPLWQKCLDVAVLALGIVCAVAGASSAAANLQAKVAAAAAVVA